MSMDMFQWLVFLQLFLLSVETAAAKVPALIVFGDSTVDTGNNNYIETVAKSNFTPYGRDLEGGQATGRFSNGRLAVDFISEAFGLPPLVPPYLDPSLGMGDLATGACFASAATGYDNATSDLFSVIPLWKELDYFKEYQSKLKSFQGDDKAQETLTEALYIISMGTNDFLENYYTIPRGRSSQYAAPDQYGDYLLGIAEDFVRELYALGARKVDLNGLPPMGCLPLERRVRPASAGECTEEYNAVAMEFNAKLQGTIDWLNKELSGIKIVYGDVYGVLNDVLQNPASYGFENVKAGCCGTGLFEMSYLCNKRSLFTCSDASTYAFWDAIHPTERLHHIMADRKMNTTLYIFL